MTSNDVSEILQRLTRIETKVDARNDHEGRLRRIELTTAGLAIMVSLVFAKAFGLNLGNPFS